MTTRLEKLLQYEADIARIALVQIANDLDQALAIALKAIEDCRHIDRIKEVIK